MESRDIVVLDLEVERSPDWCLHCGAEQSACEQRPYASASLGHTFEKIGWGNKEKLGLSLGGYFSYRAQHIIWFDRNSLEATMRQFIEAQPYIVTYNGLSFDGPVMRAILRYTGTHEQERSLALHGLCDLFKGLMLDSYDLLREIWRADPESKHRGGENRLNAVAEMNGLGSNLQGGDVIPTLWQAGNYAAVANHCQWDILTTKALFERVMAGKPLTRFGGYRLALTRSPSLFQAWSALNIPF